MLAIPLQFCSLCLHSTSMLINGSIITSIGMSMMLMVGLVTVLLVTMVLTVWIGRPALLPLLPILPQAHSTHALPSPQKVKSTAALTLRNILHGIFGPQAKPMPSFTLTSEVSNSCTPIHSHTDAHTYMDTVHNPHCTANMKDQSSFCILELTFK